jgi:hypothetical protein
MQNVMKVFDSCEIHRCMKWKERERELLMRFGFYNLVSLIDTLLQLMDCSLTFHRKMGDFKCSWATTYYSTYPPEWI